MRSRIHRFRRISRYVIYKETLLKPKDHLLAFAGSFIAISALAYLQKNLLNSEDVFFLIGSFGASSVLLFGSPKSPLAQYRNLIGGHIISALIGVSLFKLFPETLWLASALAVSMSIVLMQITKTMHPPGGATALIAVIGSSKIKALGYWFVISPVAVGAILLVMVAYLMGKTIRNYKSI